MELIRSAKMSFVAALLHLFLLYAAKPYENDCN